MELEIIRWLRERLPQSSRVLLGLGDDAAILDWETPSSLVLACDTIVEGLDFTFDAASADQIGRKALAINLSDIAAMGATPVAATISFVLPKANCLELSHQLVEGMIALADEFSVDLVGGDLTVWDGPLIITVNIAGEVGPNGCWRRQGASAGDNLLVTGRLGGSILGRHLAFQPRLEESQILSSEYTIKASIDISDGLAIDTHRLATESGLQAILDLEAIPVSEAAISLASDAQTGLTALQHALQDGEDFELLLAVPPDDTARLLADARFDCQITAIGTLLEGTGLFSRDSSGAVEPLAPSGYVHGAMD